MTGHGSGVVVAEGDRPDVMDAVRVVTGVCTLGLTDALASTDREGVPAGVGGGVAAINIPEVNTRLDETPVTSENRKHARLGSIPAQE